MDTQDHHKEYGIGMKKGSSSTISGTSPRLRSHGAHMYAIPTT